MAGSSSFVCLSDIKSESDGSKEMNEAPPPAAAVRFDKSGDGFSERGEEEEEQQPSPRLFKANAFSNTSNLSNNESGVGFDSDGFSEWERPSMPKRQIFGDGTYQARIVSESMQMDENADSKLIGGSSVGTTRKRGSDGCKKNQDKEEKSNVPEKRKLVKEQEKLLKAALKAEEADWKKLEKKKQKWAKGELTRKSIVAEIDVKVLEKGSIGGHLLSQFADMGLTFRIMSNPIEGSIVWSMTVPEEMAKFAPFQKIEIKRVELVFDAEELCNLIDNNSLMEHASHVVSRYPNYLVSYTTNRLQSYIRKRDREHFKNTDKSSLRRLPVVKELVRRMTARFHRVLSVWCSDEADLAGHIVAVTENEASYRFRSILDRLTVNANRSTILKDLTKKDLWLNTLVAIPMVQTRYAVAIWKKYPTMKSLLNIYMDPSKSVHEKVYLFKDLTTDGLLDDGKRLGNVGSRWIYSTVMAQSGCTKSDDVETHMQ